MVNLPDRPTELARLLSISVPYASAILKGERPWTRGLAITAYRKTGCRIGPIQHATDAEIDTLEKYEPTPQGRAA